MKKGKQPRTVYQSIGDIKKGLVIILEVMKEYELDTTISNLNNKLYGEPRQKNYREAKKKAVEEIERKYKVLKNLKE